MKEDVLAVSDLLSRSITSWKPNEMMSGPSTEVKHCVRNSRFWTDPESETGRQVPMFQEMTSVRMERKVQNSTCRRSSSEAARVSACR